MIDRTSSGDTVTLASGMRVGAVVVLERDPGGVEALLADRVRTVPRLVRALFGCGRPVSSTDERYSHVTAAMISRMLEQLQRRWEEDRWSWTADGTDEAQ